MSFYASYVESKQIIARGLYIGINHMFDDFPLFLLTNHKRVAQFVAADALFLLTKSMQQVMFFNGN